MELNFRKLWTVLGVACLSANLAAAPASNGTSGQTRKDDHSMVASGLMYAGPMLSEESTGIALGADYILWQVVQEGLETVTNNYYSAASTAPSTGTTGFPASSLLSGFKVHGQVTISECDNIDLFVQYTWLQRSTKTNSGAGGATTYATFLSDIVEMQGTFTAAVTEWSSSKRDAYNVLDFEIGRLSSISMNNFIVRPFFGLRGVWNTSTWTASAIGATGAEIATTRTSYQNTSGAGVRTGFDLAWQFFSNSEYFGGLKLIGMSALSGVYGRTYTTDNCTSDGGTQTAATGTNRSNKTSLNRTVPIVDLSIGLSWDMNFGGELDNDYNVELHALWETQTWIGYGKHLTATTYPHAPQTMGIQGLTVGASLEF